MAYFTSAVQDLAVTTFKATMGGDGDNVTLHVEVASVKLIFIYTADSEALLDAAMTMARIALKRVSRHFKQARRCHRSQRFDSCCRGEESEIVHLDADVGVGPSAGEMVGIVAAVLLAIAICGRMTREPCKGDPKRWADYASYPTIAGGPRESHRQRMIKRAGLAGAQQGAPSAVSERVAVCDSERDAPPFCPPIGPRQPEGTPAVAIHGILVLKERAELSHPGGSHTFPTHVKRAGRLFITSLCSRSLRARAPCLIATSLSMSLDLFAGDPSLAQLSPLLRCHNAGRHLETLSLLPDGEFTAASAHLHG